MQRLVVFALFLASIGMPVAARGQESRVLVFSKTAGFRHSSIGVGIAAVRKIGQENGFSVDATEDAGAFTSKNLARYRAVVFLNTTGDVLDAAQQDDFERYIQAGGGYVGIHSATDTEYDWPWYGRLAGAWFNGHPGNPNVRKGTFRVLDKTHPSTEGLPDRWDREDEFYNFKSIDPTIHVLVDIDEKSYEGGTNGDRHPMSWYHDFDGGRAWYTNMGHTEATFSEPLFLKHLTGGLRYAIGTGTIDFGRARPEENRFTKVVLATPLDEPVELAVLPDERVLFIERHGFVNLYSPTTGKATRIATIPVSTKYADSSQAEDGLLGLAADPGFATNGWVYMYYSPAGPEPKNVLARYEMKGDSLDLASRRVLVEIPTQREKCCHTGGSIAFDGKGNLYMSTGDNSNPFATGYAPIDERPGRSPWDAQKSSANTNDLRGKIMRIHPEPSGTYTIPEGNLFLPGTAKTRPEIYTMGHRNPYRIAVDARSGFLYWGDVGPDANEDSVGRGPRGYDEVNQARRAGNFGWPYFIGDNKSYIKTAFIDSVTVKAGSPFDPVRPINRSPNNTGLTELPPARKAFIWYPYGPSAEFPLLGSGGRTAMAGPVFHRDDFGNAARPFPQWYDNKLLIYEWMRGWIIAVTMDAKGDLASMERFMPSYKFSNPIDMQFGPNGDLYLLEYGTAWFQGNDDARLVRIEYTAGNRKPIIAVNVDKPAGALPLRVALSSAGTLDLDEDSLRYEWTVTRRDGSVLRTLDGPNPSLTFTRPGTYTASLTVTDPHGASSSAKVPIAAGNEPPTVNVDLVGGNKTFFFPGVPVRYAVRVTDREDGSLQNGRIPAGGVTVTAQYLKDGVPLGGPATAPRSGDSAVAQPVSHAAGRRLVEGGDCLACHQLNRKSIGPAYMEVARKYHDDSTAAARLVRKIRNGGSGVWGQVMMPGHPQLTEEQASQMVAYILSLADRPTRAPSLPTRGTYTPAAASGDASQGVLVLRAAYTDRGANGMPAISKDQTVVLRAPSLVVASGELSDGLQKQSVPELPVQITVVSRAGAFAKLKQLDLTGVSAVVLSTVAPTQYQAAGGKVEVRLDSATGPLIGESELIRPTTDSAAPPSQLRTALKPTSGLHDVFLVFRNPDAKGDGFLFGLLTATFEASASATPVSTRRSAAIVRPGIEVFLADVPRALRGKRVGLITNNSGIDRSQTSDIDLIARQKDLKLVALFAPEHGIRGDVEAGATIDDDRDPRTGVPVYSLYKTEDNAPTAEMLKDVDVLVYDLQEVGGRTWTYVSTMALAMQAAARKKIPFVVLDRPNPIGGEIVEGALLDPKFKSFVGMYPIPARHGLTVGELATLFNKLYGIGANLIVVRAENWRRSEWQDETGLPWVNPSPNLRSLAALTSYPGSVYFEGTTLTEGRGTDRPFEQIGAPWLNAPQVAKAMNEMRLPGIRFEPTTLQVLPTAAKYKGETIPGIRFVITDRQAYRPVRTSLLLIDEIRRQHPANFAWTGAIDRLTGSDKVRLAIEGGRLLPLLDEWDREAAQFRESSAAFQLYR